MTDMIVDACKRYSVPDYRIEKYLSNELCQYPKGSGGDDMIFTYNAKGNVQEVMRNLRKTFEITEEYNKSKRKFHSHMA